ncbi:hypothetical protein F511_39678 [Dorcoceras hygrometricum]|uniref:Uncharacterized protein n=1 Tax=Dorcoceras hygrometricum TaxID=472368 RepID=A0A2Z7BZP5_9LAMI|nr:hypothetical protein F511_39678 [Dorcoceras hygrometricum]
MADQRATYLRVVAGICAAIAQETSSIGGPGAAHIHAQGRAKISRTAASHGRPVRNSLRGQPWDTASRGPTTIVAPESQFRTCPTDHVGKRVKVRRLSCRVLNDVSSVRTNQYNQDLGLIHSTNGNHLESPKEGSSIDHQVTIYLHAQNITMFPTNETWYFASQILVSNSGGLILILTAQSTRNMFRTHSDY